MKKITLIFVLALIYGCFNKSNNKENDFVEVKDAKMDSTNNKKQMILAFNVDSLSGHWFQPHAAVINIDFTKEGTFVFNTFDTVLMKDQKLTGTYQIEANKVVLKISNFKLKDEIFQINVNEGGYFLEKEGFYLIKS